MEQVARSRIAALLVGFRWEIQVREDVGCSYLSSHGLRDTTTTFHSRFRLPTLSKTCENRLRCILLALPVFETPVLHLGGETKADASRDISTDLVLADIAPLLVEFVRSGNGGG